MRRTSQNECVWSFSDTGACTSRLSSHPNGLGLRSGCVNSWGQWGVCVGNGVGGMGDGESICGRWEVLAGTLDAGNAWLGNATVVWLTMALAP
jgi:hypothetical protein